MQRILVVEDDPHFGRQLVDLFGFHGYDVELAENGAAALHRFEESGADLILTDLMLPRMSGVDLIKQLRARPEGGAVPVIMMSAIYKNPKMFEAELRSLNVLEFLAKPFSLIDLGRKVDAILDDSVSADLSDAAVTATGSWRVEDIQGVLGEGALDFPALGTFDRLKLLQIFVDVFNCHAAGRLTLRRGKSERRIFFLNGYPVWARSEDEEELLGEVLVKLRLIDAEQKDACLALAERDGIMFRDALIRAGHLDEAKLFRAERERVQRIVVQSFHWVEGEYEFHRSDDFVDSVGVFEVNPVVCLGEAVRRFLTVNELAAEIEPRSPQVLVEGPRYRRLVGYLQLPVEVGGLLECMSGDTTIGALFRRFGMAHETLIKNLWLMFAVGIADTVEAASAPLAAAAVEPKEDLEDIVYVSGFTNTSAEFVLDVEMDDDDDAEEEEVVLTEHARSIVNDYVALMEGSYYDVLGLDGGARPAAVDRAYLAVRSRFDARKLVADDPSEIYDKAKALTDRAETAWRTLRDPASKTDYDARLLAPDA